MRLSGLRVSYVSPEEAGRPNPDTQSDRAPKHAPKPRFDHFTCRGRRGGSKPEVHFHRQPSPLPSRLQRRPGEEASAPR